MLFYKQARQDSLVFKEATSLVWVLFFSPVYTRKLATVKNVCEHVGKERVTEATTQKLSGLQKI